MEAVGEGASDYVDFVLEQLEPIRELTSSRFFGGVGLSARAVQFAMIMGNSLYFVVDDETRPKYEKMGSSCFSYRTRKGSVDVKKYYEVPGDLLEDRERLLDLARESIEIARRLKK